MSVDKRIKLQQFADVTVELVGDQKRAKKLEALLKSLPEEGVHHDLMSQELSALTVRISLNLKFQERLFEELQKE